MTDKSTETDELCASTERVVVAEPRKKGGILESLRHSPLVGADLNLARTRIDGRKADL